MRAPLWLITLPLLGAPENLTVVQGTASLSQTPSALQITVSDATILNWKNFSIQSGETVQFIQPSSNASVLNRVTGNNPSALLGTLSANGRLYLINPSGIVIGKGAVINTAAFFASTFDIADADFLSGKIELSGSSLAGIVNEGSIIAEEGDVRLISYTIDNSGSIEAANIFLQAGKHAILESSYLIHIHGNPPEDFYAAAINHSGSIHASTVVEKGGEIFLVADTITLQDHANIDASGSSGGSIDIHARSLSVAENSSLSADSLDNGCGGKIVLWGTVENHFYGRVTARGGPQGGDGGFVEISSHGLLFPKGSVSTTAPLGSTGMLLFDPTVVTISTAATSAGVAPIPPPTVGPYDYTFPGISPTNILFTDLQTFLNDNNVTINAIATGPLPAGSGMILFNAPTDIPAGPASWTWTAQTSLTLIADNAIEFRHSVGCTNAAAAGNFNVFDITAPLVTVGDTGHTLANISEITVSSGRININASNNLSVYGPAPGTGNNQIAAGIGANANVVISAGDLLLESSPGGAGGVARIIAIDDITCTLTGDLTLTAQDDLVQIATALTGNINIPSAQNMILTGGSGATASATLDIGTAGNITSTIANNYTISGGTGASSRAGFNILAGATGDITLTGNAFTFSAGNGAAGNDMSAIVEVFAGSTGNVSLTASGAGGISFFAGNGASGNAAISNAGGDVIINTTSLVLNGSTFLGSSNGGATIAASQNALINASQNISVIAGSGTGSNSAGILASGISPFLSITAQNLTIQGGMTSNSNAVCSTLGNGNLAITTTGDLNLIGGTDDNAGAGIILALAPGRNINLSIGGNLLCQSNNGSTAIIAASTGAAVNFVTLGNCTLNGGMGTLDSSARIVSSFGPVTGSIGGDLSLNASSGTLAFAAILSANSGSGGNLDLTCQSLTVSGGSANGNYAGIGVGDPLISGGNGLLSLNIIQDATLIGGSADNCPAFIQTFGNAAGNNITLTGGNLTLSGAFNTLLTGSGAEIGPSLDAFIDITLGQNIIVQGTSNNPGRVQILAGATQELVARAGLSIYVNDNGIFQNLGTGALTLVVDNQFPASPSFGFGAFITAPLATVLTASGPLRIFTSRQELNSIQSTLNGATFIQGALFANSAQERWLTYYPSIFGGAPFTLFYKDGLPTNAVEPFISAVAEPFQDWEMFSTYLIVSPYTYSVEYQKNAYIALHGRRKRLSSFQVIPTQEYTSLLQKYRDYHLLATDTLQVQ